MPGEWRAASREKRRYRVMGFSAQTNCAEPLMGSLGVHSSDVNLAPLLLRTRQSCLLLEAKEGQAWLVPL